MQSQTSRAQAPTVRRLDNKNYAQAVGATDRAPYKNAINTYLHAIAAARRDNKYAATSYMKEAIEQDPSLAEYAENDFELAITRNKL